MRISAPMLTLAGTVAGTAVAVVAYQSAASVGSSPTEPAADKTDPTSSSTSWLPCEDGWKTVGNACVKLKENVVVVHDLPAEAAPPARSARSESSGRDHAEDDADEDESDDSVEHADDDGEHEAEDSDDDAGEDHGEDEDESDHEDEPDHEDVGDDD